MKEQKLRVHFIDNYIVNPANPVVVNLIGAGGTGSQVMTALARINLSLKSLGHPGLMVRVYDNDVITEANLGRQLFAASEIGLNKAVALINRLNRFFGTNWKAVPCLFSIVNSKKISPASITISCVDTAKARFEIGDILRIHLNDQTTSIHKPLYWMDFGNSRDTGQLIISTVKNIQQPSSKKFCPVAGLPFITDEFKSLLLQGGDDDTPSCSLAESLTKQDLFINSGLANLGASLLWNMFREGMIKHRGFFLNLKDFRTQPLPV